MNPARANTDGVFLKHGPPDCMFYPVALYVLPCCTLRSTLLRAVALYVLPCCKIPFLPERKISWNMKDRTVGTVATELLFLLATLLRWGATLPEKIVSLLIIPGLCRRRVLPRSDKVCRTACDFCCLTIGEQAFAARRIASSKSGLSLSFLDGGGESKPCNGAKSGRGDKDRTPVVSYAQPIPSSSADVSSKVGLRG